MEKYVSLWLKQSPRASFDQFTKAIKRCGYQQRQVDRALFYKHSTTAKIAIFIAYVDDIILTDGVGKLKVFKKFLAREFEIEDLGALRYFFRCGVCEV